MSKQSSEIATLEAAVEAARNDVQKCQLAEAYSKGALFTAERAHKEAKDALRTALDAIYKEHDLKDYGG